MKKGNTFNLFNHWLRTRKPPLVFYDESTDVIRFRARGTGEIYFNFFCAPEKNLYVVSHSEQISRSGLSATQEEAVMRILERCIFVRPTPRPNLKKIKFKFVSIGKPDIDNFLDNAVEDISDALQIWNKYTK